jgi:mannose-1-phosphate guanylyltransferase/mannose-6-phosphate isomerase
MKDKIILVRPGKRLSLQKHVHRLENKTSEPVEIIDVQVGDYLGEDDIVRL